ncbi:hypothetical protein C4588_02050 [Candidatus Parcubacteria bacterium]|nr:MAG: hypothetical protein C4588_02050 [Candidatus Parcubacteria bacterium]
MINLPRIQSLIAPFATPTGPAMFLANEFYHLSIAAQIPNFLAIVVAITTVIGVEFSGALMCYCAIEAWQRGSKAKMTLAIFGTLIYTAIVFGGFMMLDKDKGQIFGVMILVTLVAYLGYAIYQSFETQDKKSEDELKRLKAETNLINAQTRKNKSEIKETEQVPLVRNASALPHTYTCTICQEEFDNPKKFAAHVRWAHKFEP